MNLPLKQGLCLSECMNWMKPLGSSLEHRFYALNSKYSLLQPPFPHAGIPSADSPMASSPWERAVPSPRTAAMPSYCCNHGLIWDGDDPPRWVNINLYPPCRSTPEALVQKGLSVQYAPCGPTLPQPFAQLTVSSQHLGVLELSGCSWHLISLPPIILEFKYKYSNTGHMKRAPWQFSFRLFYNSS